MLKMPGFLPVLFFFFNDTATTELYTLSLHDALPISPAGSSPVSTGSTCWSTTPGWRRHGATPAPRPVRPAHGAYGQPRTLNPRGSGGLKSEAPTRGPRGPSSVER